MGSTPLPLPWGPPSARLAVGLPALVAVLVALPTVAAPWMLDDYLHQDALRILSGEAPGPAIQGAVRDAYGLPSLFCFVPGGAAERAAMEASGILPWWSDPGLAVCFWRPLSSLIALAEHALWGGRAALSHLHTVVWAGLLAGLSAALLRRLGLGWLGLGAALLFAIDDAHVIPVLWAASRNALWAAGFAAGAAHFGLSRLRGAGAGAAAGLLLCAAAMLLAGEAGVGGLAVLLALAVVYGRGGPLGWVRALWPAALAAGLWLGAYAGSGAAVHGTVWYRDPRTEPLRWLSEAAAAAPVLASNGFGLLSGDTLLVAPELQGALIVQGLTLLVAVAVLWRRAWAGLSPEERRATAMGALGYALSLAPSLSTVPQNRLILVGGLGANLLVAVILRFCLRSLVERGPLRPLERLRGWLAWPILLVHVGWAITSWPLFSLGVRASEGVARRAQAAGLPAAEGGGALFVGVSDPALVVYMRAAARGAGQEPKGAWHLVSASGGPHRIDRLSETALRVEALGPAMASRPFERLYRGAPIEAGAVSRRGGLRFTVEEADPATGGARAVRVEAEGSLDALGYALVRWDGKGYVSAPLPAVGEGLEWPWRPGPAGY